MKVWMKLADGTKVYTAPSLTMDKEELYALYATWDGNICVADDLPDVMYRKLLHELGHKMWHGATGRDQLAVFGPEPKDEQEEAFCCWLEGRPFEILRSNGFLKFPPPPKRRR